MLSGKLWKSLRISIVIALTLMVCGAPVLNALAAVEPPSVPGLSDPAELEAFLDSVITAQLKDQHIGGATVAVVKDGDMFLTKGYGYANVETQAPVNPDTTLFLVGSVAKLFTWTAVMQLAEQGRLDLDADINQYLDFRIPATFPEPITLKHLMTHTAGFENTPFGLVAATPDALIPYGAWLAENIPARRWPPGQIPAYSNYGTTLAGYIVERVSGIPYKAYIEQNILSPLGMAHTTLRQPVPPELAADQAHGYNFLNNSFQEEGNEYINIIPAGGMRASAADMARFMIAHLQNGLYCEAGCAGDEVRILNESTAQMMHARLWTPDERMNGMDYGFMELSQNGYRLIGHAGDSRSFHSLLALLPEQNTGLFVSYNRRSSVGYDLLEAFMDHYYPASSAEASKPLPDGAARASRFAGDYQVTRIGYSGGGKILGIFYSFPVQTTADGKLMVKHPSGSSKQFIEVTPLYFEEVGGDERLLFRENDQGDIAYMHFNDLPQIALRKVAWYETQLFNLSLLAVITLLFLSALIVGLVRLVARLFRRRALLPQPALAPMALVMMALAGLILEVGLFFAVTDSWALASGQRGLLTVLGGLSILAVLLAISTAVLAFLAWRRKWWRAPARIHYTLVASGAIALVWFLTFWNQLGWQWW
jgi:CubicO group peptidase (beta-lactamase class C family)